MPGTSKFAGSPSVRLKTDKLRAEAARRHQWTTDKELAHALQISPASLSRLLRTDKQGNPLPLQNPGGTLIARILTAFPDAKFEDFFELTDDSGEQTRMAS